MTESFIRRVGEKRKPVLPTMLHHELSLQGHEVEDES